MYSTLKQLAEAKFDIDIVSKYIETNDKSLVHKIVKIIDNDEDLAIANEQFKSSATTLYRGLALQEKLTEQQILDFEKSSNFVATTRSEQIAKEYAKGRAQILGKQETKPLQSVVIVYEVSKNSEAVIFDLAIFDKSYGTLETLIKPDLAEIVRIDFIELDDKHATLDNA